VNRELYRHAERIRQERPLDISPRHALRKVLEAHPHKVGYEIEEARALGAAEAVLKGELGIDAWEYLIRSQCAQICEDRAAMLATDSGERTAGDYIEAAAEAERCADAIRASAGMLPKS
jgi:hypothetical protein